MAIEAVLRRAIGHELVVDYRTSGTGAYAKGTLVSIEGSKICIANEKRVWLIEMEAITAMRLKMNGFERDEGGTIRDRDAAELEGVEEDD